MIYDLSSQNNCLIMYDNSFEYPQLNETKIRVCISQDGLVVILQQVRIQKVLSEGIQLFVVFFLKLIRGGI